MNRIFEVDDAHGTKVIDPFESTVIALREKKVC